MSSAPPLLIAWPPAGHYVLAVSGGADSMALMDLCATAASARGYQLVVAHFDHGLRPTSAADYHLVRQSAGRLDLPFVGHHAGLPARTSEAAARAARYTWLQEVAATHEANAIITAHHADDVLETNLLNLARGSGRRGLAPMRRPAGSLGVEGVAVVRPLIGVTRSQLRAYASRHHLLWNEDPTNADTTNPRNFIRHQLLPAAPPAWHDHYQRLIDQLAGVNHRIDHQLDQLLDTYTTANGYRFPRPFVRDLSPAELAELLLAGAYRLQPSIELDRRLIAEVVMFAKTGRPGRRRPLRQGLFIGVEAAAVVLKIANPQQN